MICSLMLAVAVKPPEMLDRDGKFRVLIPQAFGQRSFEIQGHKKSDHNQTPWFPPVDE